MKDVRFDGSVGESVRQKRPDSPRFLNVEAQDVVHPMNARTFSYRGRKHIHDPDDEVDRYKNGDDRKLSQSGFVTTEHRFVASVLSIFKAHQCSFVADQPIRA